MKKNYLISFLLLLVLAFDAGAQNLLSNPGFENTNPQDWWGFQVGGGGAATIAYDSPEVHTGNNAAHINVATAAAANYNIQLNLPHNFTAVAQTKYKLTFYGKASATISIHIAAQRGAVGNYEYLGGTTTNLSTSYALKEFVFTTPADQSGPDALRFNIFVGTTTGDYYFDDFNLIVVPDVNLPAPTPPTLGAYYTDIYRNMFLEMGKDASAIDAKLDAAFDQLFHGDPATEAVYYEVAPDMALIKDINSNDVRSEGMSYGMMIAVQLDKKEEFDRLWKFAKTYMQHKTGPRAGYFAWQVSGSDPYTVLDSNSASDGEEYFAMSLFFAAHRWGNGTDMFNYEAEAQNLLDLMLNLETRNGGVVRGLTNVFNKTEKQVVFTPEGPNALYTDPSYHIPGFYKLWAIWGDQDNQLWEDIADTSEVLLLKAMHPTTGLTADYTTFNGEPKATGFNANSHIFAYDSWRVIGNIAMDAHWFGNEGWQSTQVNKLLQFFTSQGPGYKALYERDGTPATTNTASGLISMNGAGTLASSETAAWTYLDALYNQSIPTGTYRYYDGMLYLLSMLHASGNFKIYKPLPTGINNKKDASELISVYPNPTSTNEFLTVEAKEIKEGTLFLKDASGRTLLESKLKNGSALLNLPELSQGIYYVQIIGDQTRAVKKVFIK